MAHSLKKEAAASRDRKMKAMTNAGNGPMARESTNYATLGTNLQAVDRQKIPTRKRGGRIEGKGSKKRLDRKAHKGAKKRASGGKTPEPLTVDPEGPLGKALIKNKPRGAYPNVNFERDVPQRAAGGRIKKGSTTVNVMVAPQGGGDAPKPVPVPVPVGGGAPAAPPPAPPMAAGPGAGAGPMLPRPGMPPMPMRKHGGRIKKRVKGGSVKVDAGAGSGLGRLAKTANVSRSANA